MVLFTIISGNAGTGKSFLLSKYIDKVINNNSSFVVLAFTHAAVNNIKNICLSNINDKNKQQTLSDKFMTIHKYFHINIETNKVSYYKFDHINVMFIDEYSFISIELFKTILPILFTNVDKVVLCGDYKQIKTVDYNDNITYDKLIKYANDISNINSYNIYTIRHYENSILSLEALQDNLLNCVILKTNHRSNDEINNIVNMLCFSYNEQQQMKTTNNINNHDTNTYEQQQMKTTNNINNPNNINNHDKDITNIITKLLVNKDDVIKLIADKNYCFISSMYRYLETINHLVNKYYCIKDSYNIINGKEEIINYTINNIIMPDTPMITKLMIRTYERIRITENTKEFINGDEYIFIEYNKQNNYIMLMDDNNVNHYLTPVVKKYSDDIDLFYYPILPSYLLTFHKSQGLSIDNVIICLDGLFDFTLLYTGITRARHNINFFVFDEAKLHNIIETKISHINEQYKYLETIFDNDFVKKNKDKIIYK